MPEYTAMEKVGRKFRSYDKFSAGAPGIKIDFDGAGPGYKSYMGAFVSIVYIILVSVFLYSKCATLYHDTAINIKSTLVENGIHMSHVFSNEDGFFVAAAITAYDNETEPPSDLAKYGELVFQRHTWGEDDG